MARARDGALAKASGRASTRGAFFDSVTDRLTDALILGGIGWYLQSRHHGHASMLVFAILAASTLVSYQRAKAESLGFNAKGGLMERAERIILLCIGVAFSAVLVPVLWVMLVLTAITAAQRFVKVWRQASRPETEAPGAMAERWRAWRRANGWGSGTPRPGRFAQGTQRGSTRWHELRSARLARLERDEAAGGDSPSTWRRRTGSRRP
jgi:CDP-diacylglycerol--glycerol-3-phosphate 3-phosphatidyltransferase